MQDSDELFIIGIVFDTYLLNQEKWAKVLQLLRPQRGGVSLEKNVVYKVTDATEVEEVGNEIRINDFVGRISYLAELEDKYQLGIGVKPGDTNKLLESLSSFLDENDII